jgi:NADPH:quinone reductase-like Zn-dependent oxidoreductase
VGSYAVQIAKEQGAHVIATTSSGDPALISRLGADQVVSGKFVTLHDQISDVDLVFDTGGGERLAHSHMYIKDGGILVSVAKEPPQANNPERNIQAKYFVVEQNSNQLKEISNLIQSGKLLPIIDRVFQLRDARNAFEYLQGKHGAGKIVLEVTK